MLQLELLTYDTPIDELWKEMSFVLERPLSKVFDGLSKKGIGRKEAESLIQENNGFYVEGDNLKVGIPPDFYHMSDLLNLDGILREGIRPNSSLHSDKNRPTVFLSYNPNSTELLADGSGSIRERALLQIDRNMVNPIPVDHDGNPTEKYAHDNSKVQLGVFETVPPLAIIGVYFGIGHDYPKSSQIQEIVESYGINAYPINIASSGPSSRPGSWKRGIAEARLI